MESVAARPVEPTTRKPSVQARALRFGLITAAGVALIVLFLLVVIVWTIANRPARSTSELVAEAQLLVAGAGILISAVLGGTTIYYARQARELVVETREARKTQQAHRDAAAREQRDRQLVAAVTA